MKWLDKIISTEDDDEILIDITDDDEEEVGLDMIAFEHEIKEDENGEVWVNILDFQKFIDWLKKGLL